MYWHSSVSLRGPISHARDWWKFPASQPRTAEDVSCTWCAPGAVAVEEIRAELVARIRREIADGRYDTPEKWSNPAGTTPPPSPWSRECATL
jgi:hypothetical protein